MPLVFTAAYTFYKIHSPQTEVCHHMLSVTVGRHHSMEFASRRIA